MKKVFLIIGILFLIFSNINLFSYREEISKINEFSKGKNYNKEYALIIDYNLHSSLNRGVLLNLKTQRKVFTFKVAHGRGKNKYLSFKKEFSNKVGSNKSSLGFAVIDSRGNSSWGEKFNYRIKGLSKTNSNIFKRNIVLHSWGGIPKYYIFPLPLPQSQGCPTVSNSDLLKIDRFIKSQKNKKIIIYTTGNG